MLTIRIVQALMFRCRKASVVNLALSGQLLSQTHDLASIIEIFRSLGVDAIDLWPENIPGGETSEERARYDGKDIERAHDLLQASQIAVACVTLGGTGIKGASRDGSSYATKALIFFFFIGRDL